jgi:hypothetical protein
MPTTFRSRISGELAQAALDCRLSSRRERHRACRHQQRGKDEGQEGQ